MNEFEAPWKAGYNISPPCIRIKKVNNSRNLEYTEHKQAFHLIFKNVIYIIFLKPFWGEEKNIPKQYFEAALVSSIFKNSLEQIKHTQNFLLP